MYRAPKQPQTKGFSLPAKIIGDMIFFPKFWVKSKKNPKILIFGIRLRKKMSSMGKLLKLLKKKLTPFLNIFIIF